MCAASGELVIDLAALRQNYIILDSKTPEGCETACAIKADAYGIGMQNAASALWNAGARSFFVATLDEGVALRGVLTDAVIYVLNGFLPVQAHDYAAHRLIPVLNSLGDILAYQSQARLSESILPCALHFDTGMNRLGIPAYEAKKIEENQSVLSGLEIKHIMTHFTSSEQKDHPSMREQYNKFLDITNIFQDVKRSLCNSGGIFHAPFAHADLTRPGIALYGGNPAPEAENPMCPVISLSAPVLQVRNVQKNETAGYNETYRFSGNTAVATVSIGYADGLFRSLGDAGVLYWKGYALPIRGRVSMDLVVCDLINVPEKEYPQAYDAIEIIGRRQTIDDLAHAAGTISYEILTALGPRYHRSYIG